MKRPNSRSELLSSSVSPFQVFADIPADDFSLGLDEHYGGPHGYRMGSQGQCPGLDTSATSAPIGTLDNLGSLSHLQSDFRSQRQQNAAAGASGGAQTAAQRLMGGQSSTSSSISAVSIISEQRSSFQQPQQQGGELPRSSNLSLNPLDGNPTRHWPMRFLSTPIEGTVPLVMDLSSAIPPTISESPPTAAALELARFGESFGAHLISPRMSEESSGPPRSRASRSSLELLLGPSRGSTPTSRQSLDSLQGMLRLVNGRASWEVRTKKLTI